MIRCLLVDDHPVVRAGYSRLLEQSQRVRVVGEAGDAESGYREFTRLAPHVTIVDLNLPGAGGLHLTRRICARAPEAAVLVFTMYETPLLAQQALEAGARGFVTKRSAPDVLLDAVQYVHEGRRYLSRDVEAPLRQETTDTERHRISSLSPREAEIFRLLAQGQPPGECARLLNLSQKTIANYQTLIREKLGVDTGAALAHLALRHGLIDTLPAGEERRES